MELEQRDLYGIGAVPAGNPPGKHQPPGPVKSYRPQILLCIGLLLLAGLWFWWSERGDWVYKVNGEPISRAEWQREVGSAESFYAIYYGMNLNQPGSEKIKQELSMEILQNMVDRDLLLQAAARAGITAAPADVQGRILMDSLNYGGQQGLEQALQAQGSNMTEYHRQVVEALTILALRDLVTKGVTVSEAEIRAEYQNDQQMLTSPEQVKVGQILVATKEQASALIAQLNRGANFEKLAAGNSIDPGVKQNHGIIGYITRDDPRLPESFKQAAFATPAGSYTRVPVQTGNGWYVLFVFDKKPPQSIPYAEVRSDLQQAVLSRKQNADFISYLQSLRQNCLIIRRVQQRDVPKLF